MHVFCCFTVRPSSNGVEASVRRREIFSAFYMPRTLSEFGHWGSRPKLRLFDIAVVSF